MRRCIFLIIIALAVPVMAADKWNPEFIKDGVSVFTREIPGSSLKAFMAEGNIQASIETVNSILCDNPGQVNWMPDCIVSYDLRTDSKDLLLSYNETKAPIVNNRDVIVETRIRKEKNRIIHEFRAIERPDLVPEKKGKVRIKDMSGRWELTYSGGCTHVIYTVSANPGGVIPLWLANMASKDIPYRTLMGLRKMAAGR